MNPFLSLADYERYIYTLPQQHNTIRRSTLGVVLRGATVAVLRGELEFQTGTRLVIRETVTFVAGNGEIRDYGYEVWKGDMLLYWYDSQPHPHDLSLASTHPHHKHIPPDIKHNRVFGTGSLIYGVQFGFSYQ